MILKKVKENIEFLKQNIYSIRLLILFLGTLSLFLIQVKLNKIYTDESFYNRMIMPELELNNELELNDNKNYDNSISVSKSIAIYGKSIDKNFLRIIASSLQDCPVIVSIIDEPNINSDGYFIVSDSYIPEKGYFVEIFINFDSSSSSILIDPFLSIQPNSDILFIGLSFFKMRWAPRISSLIIHSHFYALFHQLISILAFHVKTRLSYLIENFINPFFIIITRILPYKKLISFLPLKNPIFLKKLLFKGRFFASKLFFIYQKSIFYFDVNADQFFVYNSNKLYISLTRARDDIRQLVHLVRCLCNIESHSLGSYYYFLLSENNHISMESTAPFVICMAIYFLITGIYQSTIKLSNNYWILLFLFTPLVAIQIHPRGCINIFRSLVFYYAINFKVGFLYALFLYFRELLDTLKRWFVLRRRGTLKSE